ncbi:hypothetical protein Plhal304r1_c030g0096931 [Plasmopara halstedii]
MVGNRAEIAEFAHLHTINRVLSATRPGKDFTFDTKWKIKLGTADPSKHLDIFESCATW